MVRRTSIRLTHPTWLTDLAKAADPVENPSHYKLAGGVEVYDVLSAAFPEDPLSWQVGKYLLRWKRKNGVEDLKKARWYLDKLIAREGGERE